MFNLIKDLHVFFLNKQWARLGTAQSSGSSSTTNWLIERSLFNIWVNQFLPCLKELLVISMKRLVHYDHVWKLATDNLWGRILSLNTPNLESLWWGNTLSFSVVVHQHTTSILGVSANETTTESYLWNREADTKGSHHQWNQHRG